MTPPSPSLAATRWGSPPVLRDAGQGGQLPGRRVGPRHHRPGKLPAGLAAVPARGVGRRRRAAPQGPRARPRAPPAQVAAGPGAAGRAGRLGPSGAGGAGRRRLRRGQPVPAWPGAARAGLPGAGPRHHQRLPPGCGPRGRAVCGPWPPAGGALPPAALVAAAAGTGRGRAGGPHGRLAPRRRRPTAALPVRGAAGAPGRVRLRRATRGGELAVRSLVAEWPDGEPEPVAYWLASLPESTPLERLVGLAKLRWRVEHDYRELKDALGLDHFEGRSFKGWHHHVTLVSAAHAFVTLQRLDPKAAASA